MSTFNTFLIFSVCAALSACTAQPTHLPSRFYAYWQKSPEGSGIMGTPTKYYTELFSSRGPSGRLFGDEKSFYPASRGDRVALHAFLHSPLRDDNSSGGEGWVADMAVLALAYGDEGIFIALQSEDAATKAAVVTVVRLELLPEDQATFPKTLALRAAQTPRPNHALQRTLASSRR